MHAINRGIGFEGLGTVLAGLWGSGNGTNTFGENVGAIGVTKVTVVPHIVEKQKKKLNSNHQIAIIDI